MQFRASPPAGCSAYVCYGNKSVSECGSVKFPGMVVDGQLKFEEHKFMLQLKRNYALLWRNLRTGVGTDSFRIFYFSYVESRLQYGIIFWWSASYARVLFTYQKKKISGA